MSEVLAGKIGVTNGGEWNAETYYEEATFVRHQNNLYLSNLPSTGVEPTNEEYWMLAMEGFSGEDVQTLIDSINNILNGTTQVGNAKTLDGHGAEYFFPKSGGVVNGNVTVKADDTSQRIHALQNSVRRVFQTIAPSGNYNLYDGTNGKAIIVSTVEGENSFNGTASGNLPLTNGKVSSLPLAKADNGQASVYKNNSATVDGGLMMMDYDASGKSAGLRVSANINTPHFVDNDGSFKELLHTGNKPCGTYTGNGDATSRTVNIGGINGGVLVIRNSNYSTLVLDSGAISIDGNGVITGIPYKEVHYVNGVLTLATTNVALNQNGTTNTYYAL